MYWQDIEDEQLENTAEKTDCHSDSVLIHQIFQPSLCIFYIYKIKLNSTKTKC